MKNINLSKISKWVPFIYSVILTLLGIGFWLIGECFLDFSFSSEIPQYLFGFGILFALFLKGPKIINFLVRNSGWTFVAFTIISVCLIIFDYPNYGDKVLREYFFGICLLIIPIILYRMKDSGYGGMIMATMITVALAFIAYKMSGFFSALVLILIAITLIFYCEHKKWFGEKSIFYSILFWFSFLAVGIFIASHILFSDDLFWILVYKIKAFLNPETNFTGDSYIYTLVRSLISESVLFGQGGMAQGLGSTSDHPYFSYYFLSYFSNSFGLWVLIVVPLLFVGFFYVCFRKIKNLPFLGKLFSVSILFYIILQTLSFFISNLGYGFFINTSLPFVSEYNLWINMTLVGFLLAVQKTEQEFKAIEKMSSFDCDFVTKLWILLMGRVTGTEFIEEDFDDLD